MTPEEAKTCLSLCPPQDETNPDVPNLAQARELATANPELTAWWEREKNFDLLFSYKLVSLAPPPELQPTIMRGGATIFFASRLIEETASEETDDDEDASGLLPSPAAAALADVGLPLKRDAAADAQSNLTKRRILRMVWIMFGFICLVVLLYLFSIGFTQSNNGAGGREHSPLTGRLAEVENKAAEFPTTANTAPTPGQTLEEMKKYLDDNHSPNPFLLPPLVSRAAPAAIITVSAEKWYTLPVTFYTVQTGEKLSHLAIVKAIDLVPTELPKENYTGIIGAFDEHIWFVGGYVYIQLTPAEPKT